GIPPARSARKSQSLLCTLGAGDDSPRRGASAHHRLLPALRGVNRAVSSLGPSERLRFLWAGPSAAATFQPPALREKYDSEPAIEMPAVSVDGRLFDIEVDRVLDEVVDAIEPGAQDQGEVVSSGHQIE